MLLQKEIKGSEYMAKFTEVFDDVTKYGRKIPTNKYLSEGKYAIVDQGQNTIAGYTDETDGLYEDVPVIVFGDHTRILKYIDFPCFLGADGVKLLKTKKENANYKYLYYALCNVNIPNTGYNRHFKWLKESEFDIHSCEEQKYIVDVLDKVNELIDLRKKQLSKLDELVKSRFVELFGSLNDNEKGLDVVSIEDLCTLIKDGTHQTPIYTEDIQNGFKFLSSKDVMTQKICWDEIKYIPAELHEKLYATIQPMRNDILMSKNGVNYGVAAVNDTDAVFDIYVSLALLRPKTDRVNPVYLRCAINNPDTKRQFDSSIKGIGVPNLHLGEIKKTKVLLPTMDKQNEFATFVEQVDKSKFEVKESLEKLETLKKALMQEYFG